MLSRTTVQVAYKSVVMSKVWIPRYAIWVLNPDYVSDIILKASSLKTASEKFGIEPVEFFSK